MVADDDRDICNVLVIMYRRGLEQVWYSYGIHMVLINTPDPDSCPANYVLISRPISLYPATHRPAFFFRECLLDEWIDRTATPGQYHLD